MGLHYWSRSRNKMGLHYRSRIRIKMGLHYRSRSRSIVWLYYCCRGWNKVWIYYCRRGRKVVWLYYCRRGRSKIWIGMHRLVLDVLRRLLIIARCTVALPPTRISSVWGIDSAIPAIVAPLTTAKTFDGFNRITLWASMPESVAKLAWFGGGGVNLLIRIFTISVRAGISVVALLVADLADNIFK